MDSRLEGSAACGSIQFLREIIAGDENMIGQKVIGSGDTILHIAARFCHMPYVAEVLRLRPLMAIEENDNLEKPLHEACRRGHLGIVKLLLNVAPLHTSFSKRDDYIDSVFFAACEGGHLHIVKHLIKISCGVRLLLREMTLQDPCLHSALSSYNPGKVTEALKHLTTLIKENKPNREREFRGYCTHSQPAYREDHHHEEVAKELKNLNVPDLCLIPYSEGSISLIHIMLSFELVYETTNVYGETILHSAVRSNDYNLVKFLTSDWLDTSKLLNMRNDAGNTALHLAAARARKVASTMIASYLLKAGAEVNFINLKGKTPLDVAEEDKHYHSILVSELIKAGGKRSDELSPRPVSEESVHLLNITDSQSNEPADLQTIALNIVTNRTVQCIVAIIILMCGALLLFSQIL